ncbi:aminotransferase class III-fold pyridoxal phosphate-dependent enzyme [Shouchella sp. 1P09AA]|uniref:aminotransferase family protein n=1 Tax=unclassified Shouchella TaxID=2893065 RepID=UPI0039A32AA1
MKKNHVIYPYMEENKKRILKEVNYAEGVFVFDSEGHKYLDGLGGLMNIILGYKNKRINNAISSQLNKIPFVNLWSNTNEKTEELALRILGKSGNDFSKLMYSTTGSEAIELAIKLARKVSYNQNDNKKKYVVGLDISYHGTTYGAMSVTGIEQYEMNTISPKLPGIALIATPDFNKNDHSNYIKYLNAYFEKNHENIAAFLLEPIMASSGVIKLDSEILSCIQMNCKRYSILLISDEVTTAYFRTGSFFAYQSLGIKPDIVCISKAMTNGYLPMAAVLINDKVSDLLDMNEPIPHFSTQNGNPVCAAAAIEVLNILDEGPNVNSEIKRSSNKIYQALKNRVDKLPTVYEIRAEGMMFAVELRNKNKVLSFNEVWAYVELMKKNGLLVYPFATYKTSGIALLPPYIINDEEVLLLEDIIYNTLVEINIKSESITL